MKFLPAFIFFAGVLAAVPVMQADPVFKLYAQGYNAYHARDYKRAVKAWSDAITFNPKDATAYKNRGLAYKELKEWDKAAADAGMSITLTPDEPDGYNLRADIFHEKRRDVTAKGGQHASLAEGADSDQAIADYTEALRLGSLKQPSPEKWVMEEGGREGYNNIEKMIASYGVMLKLTPADAGKWYRARGDGYGMLWEWDKAISDFDELLKIDPGNIHALQQRARYSGQKQMTSVKPLPEAGGKEIEDLSELIRLKPGGENYVWRGDVYARQGDYDKAMTDYQQALALSNGKDNGAYEGIAGIYEARGDWNKAIENYNHIIDTNDYGDLCNHNAIYDYRAELYMEAGEYEKAIADINKGMEGQRASMVVMRAEDNKDYGPSDALERDEQGNRESMEFYLVQRGEAWQRAGIYDKALADFDSAIATNPKGRRGLGMKAWLQATCVDAKYRNGAVAVELAMKACTHGWWGKPNDIDTLAAAYAESGKWDDAVAYEKMAAKVTQDGGYMPEHSAEMEKKQAELIKDYNTREALYEQKKPFRGPKDLMDWGE